MYCNEKFVEIKVFDSKFTSMKQTQTTKAKNIFIFSIYLLQILFVIYNSFSNRNSFSARMLREI